MTQSPATPCQAHSRTCTPFPMADRGEPSASRTSLQQLQQPRRCFGALLDTVPHDLELVAIAGAVLLAMACIVLPFYYFGFHTQ